MCSAIRDKIGKVESSLGGGYGRYGQGERPTKDDNILAKTVGRISQIHYKSASNSALMDSVYHKE